jgi:SMI1 / KNR4 family (SUKH-1)
MSKRRDLARVLRHGDHATIGRSRVHQQCSITQKRMRRKRYAEAHATEAIAMYTAMKKLHLANCGPKLSARALKRLETAIGGKLPQDYLKFLSLHNGGETPGYVLRIPTEPGILLYMHGFLSATESARGLATVLLVKRNCEEYIPSDTIPIAFFDEDDLLLLRTSGARRGQVDLKLSGNVTDHEDPESGVVPVAKSFREFVGKLTVLSKDDEEYEYGMW